MSDRIGPWATALGALTVVAMVLIVVSIVHGALLGPLPSDLREVAGLAPGADVSRGRIALIALAGALPAVASLYVLWQARTLAALYGRGRVLTTDSADAIRRIGAGLLAMVALDILSGPLTTVLASLGNPPGQRVLALSLEGADLGLVLAGGVMTMIGWAMTEAVRVADENRSFV